MEARERHSILDAHDMSVDGFSGGRRAGLHGLDRDPADVAGQGPQYRAGNGAAVG